MDIETSGGNILARWQHVIDSDSNFALRAYYDKTNRRDPSYRDDLDTVDIDFQYQWNWTPRQQWLWGLNYHLTKNRNVGKGIFNVDPDFSRDQLVGLFIQDQISLLDTLQLTLGTKYEHNDFSGDEWQPSGRIAWDFSERQTVWAAVSRAVRVPTRLERDIAVDVTDPAGNPVLRLEGNSKFDAEVLVAHEVGYRWQVRDNLSLDLAEFNNRYSGLSSLELGNPYVDSATSVTVIPVVNENRTNGTTRGIEAQVNFSPLPMWRLATNYSYLDMHLESNGLDLNRGVFLADSTPRHQFGLRSFFDLPANYQLDIHFRYLSAISRIPDNVNGEGLPEYAEMDVRIAKQLTRQLEMSLVGQNLLHDHHVEFGTPATRGEIERGIYFKLVWNDLGK